MSTFEEYQQCANELLEKLPNIPRFGIVCGSGLGNIVKSIKNPIEFPYTDIKCFPTSTVVGHANKLVCGEIGDTYVVCFCGRFHSYEGFSMQQVIAGIRFMKCLGIESVFLTNAAGGLNRDYKIGDLMIIEDHIDFVEMSGKNALVGPNDERFGPRFPSIDGAYNKNYRKVFCKVMQDMGQTDILRSGVYFFNSGPCYESPAEINFISTAGADAVGMSTVPEVNAARHMGMKVMAISLITNCCKYPNDNRPSPNHKEVLEVGEKRSELMSQAIYKTIEYLSHYSSDEELEESVATFPLVSKQWYLGEMKDSIPVATTVKKAVVEEKEEEKESNWVKYGKKALRLVVVHGVFLVGMKLIRSMKKN
ncbi:hypothetical protein WA158_004177 [Blastocystis sp. Blastoise]